MARWVGGQQGWEQEMGENHRIPSKPLRNSFETPSKPLRNITGTTRQQAAISALAGGGQGYGLAFGFHEQGQPMTLSEFRGIRGVTPISRFIRGPDWRLALGCPTDPLVSVPLVGFDSPARSGLMVIELKKPSGP